MNRRIFIFSFLSLFFLGCAADFYTQIFDKSDKGLNDIIFPEPKPWAPKPIVVSQFSATLGDKYINQINLSWKEVSQGVYYWRLFWYDSHSQANEVLKKIQGEGFYQEELLSGNENCSTKLIFSRSHYEHNSVFNQEGEEQALSSGSTYYYVLKGYDSGNRIVAYSSEVVKGKTAIVPYEVTASRDYQPQEINASAFITLKWKWDNPQSTFKVERMESPFTQNSQWIDRGDIKATLEDGFYTYKEEFTHTSDCKVVSKDDFDCNCQIGKEFAYRVYAVTDGKNSLSSQIVRGLTAKWGTPAAVTGLKASQGLYGEKIHLKWDETSGATGYSLYVKTKSTANWEAVTLDDRTKTKFDYKTPLANSMQFYVTASNSLGEGVACEPVVGYIIPEIKAVNASFLKFDDKIEISWSRANVAEGEIVYDLYRSETVKKEVLEEERIAKDLTETSYSDTTVTEKGKVYYYSVRPKNKNSGNEGIGKATAYSDSYGVRGLMPAPEFEVSTGQNDITLTFSNRPSYCTVSSKVKRWVYSPSYSKKPSAVDGTPSQPTEYLHTLQFINRWSRVKKESTVFEEQNRDSINDKEASFGWNDYSVSYCFSIPEISYKGYSEAVTKSGWRAISDEEFLINALRVVDYSQSYLHNIHQPGTGAAGFDSVSKQGFNGWSSSNCGGKGGNCDGRQLNPNKGCFHYQANLNGLSSVTVPLMYNDFEAFDMIFNSMNGKHQTHVSLSADGTLTGFIDIKGIYPGRLTFNLNITDSVKSGGNYKVKQDGKNETSHSWDVDRKYFKVQ